jgi:hypothetical protein
VLGKQAVTALRLARYFGTSEEFWKSIVPIYVPRALSEIYYSFISIRYIYK